MAIDLSKNEDLQRLFLLELLVESVKFDYNKIDLGRKLLDSLKQTCVRFDFLNFPTIEVCEEDFCPTEGDYKAKDIVFKNGKSCFFSLSCLPVNTKCLLIGATIIRRKDDPPSVVMGTTCIKLGKSFVNVLNYKNVTGTEEACESLKDTFRIIDDRGLTIGTITLFIRLSCFGKAIITHFKIPQDNGETGYLFTNTNEPQQGSPATSSHPGPGGYSPTPVAPGFAGSTNHAIPNFGQNFSDVNSGMYPGPRNINASGDMTGGGTVPGNMGPGAGSVPGMVPGGMTGMVPGGMTGMVPGGMTGMVPGGMTGMVPGGMTGMAPGGMTGMAPGGMVGIPAGEPGFNTYGYIPDMIGAPTFQFNRADTFPSIGIGEQTGNMPYSPVKVSSISKRYIDEKISKQYKELSVSINGNEFTINVLRKSRKKREKTPEFQICGRIPVDESSDSDVDETTITNTVSEVRESQSTTKEARKQIEIPSVNLRNINTYKPIEGKPLKLQPLETIENDKPKNIPFHLCECDIPLPKGFRLEDLNVKTKYSKISQPTLPPSQLSPSPADPSPVPLPVIPTKYSPPDTSVTQIVTPAVSYVSSAPIAEKEKEKKTHLEKPTYCLNTDCPMGFLWPPDVPQQKKIVKVPCCSQMPMLPGSLGMMGEQITLQMANGVDPDFYGNFVQNRQGINSLKDHKHCSYTLKLGAANLSNNKSTKIIMELPVPKRKLIKVESYDHDTQYLEADIPIPEKIPAKPDGGKKKKGKKGKGEGKGKGERKGKEERKGRKNK